MSHPSQWHIWYAWYPVLQDDENIRQLLWREDVMRRRVMDLNTGRLRWEYQAIDTSILTD